MLVRMMAKNSSTEARGGFWENIRYYVLTPMAWIFILAFGASTWTGEQGEDATGNILVTFYGVLAIIAAIYACYLISQRRDDIRSVANKLAIIEILFPIGPVLGIALPRYIHTQPARDGRRMTLIYIVSVVVIAAREIFLLPTSFLGTMAFSSRDEAAGITDYSTIVLLLVVTTLVPIWMGYNRRTKDVIEEKEQVLEQKEEQLEVTSDRLREQEKAAETIESELVRKEEREAIAREIHDTLGHNLALINLYSGGLELMVEDDEAKEQASQIRKSAQQAVDELRSVIQIMRDGVGENGIGQQSFTLTELDEVIENVLSAGQHVSSNVMISNPETAPDVLTKATYRIIQELLTNAMKHSPNELVRVRVVGSPESGLSIKVTNPMKQTGSGTSQDSEPGGDHRGGITGIRERAEALGGTLNVSTAGGVFAIEAWLPWGS